MGTKEEPICLSDSEDLEGETRLIPIMVSSSSDEEDQMDSCSNTAVADSCNRRTHTSRSFPKLKIDQEQLNLLRATVKLKKLNRADVSLNKTDSKTTVSASGATNDGINGFDSTVSNVIFDISDDEEELPSYLFSENSEQLGTKVVVKTEPNSDERSLTPVPYKVKEEEKVESPSSSMQDDEGLFQRLKRLDSSGRVNASIQQNHCDSNFKNDSIERFFTGSPKRAAAPAHFVKSEKTACHNGKMKQATFESLSPHKKLFPYMPMQRHFQALPLTPPLHSTVNRPPCGFFKGYFTESQMNSIEALQEEGFNESILNLVLGYMSTRRAPPPQLVFYILNKILLNGKKQSVTTLAYLTLKRIQVLHPSSADMHNCGLDWDFMTTVVEQMELSGCRCEPESIKNSSDSCQASQNASLAFAFILQVLEKECERKLLSTCMRKCLAYRLLSLNKAFRNVRNVLQWIKEAVDHHSNACSHNSGLRSSCPTSTVIVSSSSNLPCPLSLLQHLLQLVMIVNEQPRDCASQIADELVSCYLALRSLEQKTLLLQTLESHLVRSETLDCVLQSRFPMEDFSSSGISLPTGLCKIVDHHFYRKLQYGDNCSDVDSSSDYHFESVQQECEEFVMLLAYLMQSYICLHEEKLQAQQMTPDPTDERDSFNVHRDGLHLSVEDVVTLSDVREHVGKLRQRLEKVCPMFSKRTYLLFELMDSMSSFTT